MTAALHPYPSLGELERRTQEAAASAGVELGCLGHSRQGRPLHALRLAGGPAELLVTANIHGPEYVSALLALELAARFERHDPLRRRATLTVVPCLNPDGYQRTWERGGEGPLRELRPNANGVDLNRNFPLPRGAARSRWPGSGSQERGAATYIGSEPLSEPESRAVEAWLAAHEPRAALGLHSFMGATIPAHVRDGPSFARYRDLSRVFREAQKHPYRHLASRRFDGFTGELEDHVHHNHGAWALCVESFPVSASFRQYLRAPTTFWRFNPRDPSRWVHNDAPAALALLEAMLDTPRSSE